MSVKFMFKRKQVEKTCKKTNCLPASSRPEQSTNNPNSNKKTAAGAEPTSPPLADQDENVIPNIAGAEPRFAIAIIISSGGQAGKLGSLISGRSVKLNTLIPGCGGAAGRCSGADCRPRTR